jgi:hypothetical protein
VSAFAKAPQNVEIFEGLLFVRKKKEETIFKYSTASPLFLRLLTKGLRMTLPTRDRAFVVNSLRQFFIDYHTCYVRSSSQLS